MRDRLVVLGIILLSLWGTSALGMEWYVRVNSDDINGIAGTAGTLWVVTNGGGTLLWDLQGGQLDKFLRSQPDLCTDETEGAVRVWLEDTLLTNSFTTVALGPSGTVWLGCESGINVVDASLGDPASFVFWPPFTASTSGLASNLVTTIVRQPGSSIVWIGTRDAGICRYDVDSATWLAGYTAADGLASNRVNCIYFDGHNRVWVGTDAGVSQFNMNFGTWTTYDTGNSGLPSDFVTGVAEVGCCYIWFTTDAGAARLEISGDWETYDTSTDTNILSNDMLGIIHADDAGPDQLWIWSDLGITFYDLGSEFWGSYTYENTSGGLLSNSVRGVVYDQGTFFVGTQRGLCTLNSVWDSYFEGRLAFNEVRAVACNEDEVWLGTYGRGANLLSGWDANTDPKSPGTWSTFSYAPSDAIASDFINDIVLDYRFYTPMVWFATNLGVSLFDKGSTWRTFDTSNTSGALPSNRVSSIALDPRPDGGLIRTWFGTDKGLALLAMNSTEQWDTFTTSNSDLPSNFVTCLAPEVRDGEYLLWIGTNWGVAVLDVVNLDWTLYNVGNSGLVSDNVRCINIDREGTVWIGTTNGISRFTRPSSWTTIRTSTPGSGLGSNTINSIIFGSDDLVWIGTSRGLTKFDRSTMTGTRYFGANSGLIDDNVFDLCFQPCTGLWAATRGGVSIIRQATPTLSNSSVEPQVGSALDDYTFAIHFEDVDDQAPSVASVVVGATAHTLEFVPGSGTPGNGDYSTTLTLSPGHWWYYFYFEDSDGCPVRYPTSGTIEGPDIHDDFEPDNQCIDAHLVLADGTEYCGHNLVPLGDDEDWFYFRAEKQVEYTIEVDAQPGASTWIHVFRNDCTQEVANGKSFTPLTFVPDTSGYYFVRITDYTSSAASAGEYCLSIWGNQWPMMGHIYTRAATVAAIGPQYYLERVTYSTDPTIDSTPAIDSYGNLYFGASYGQLVSLDSDFSVRWVFGSGDTEPVCVSPALSPDGSAVYFGTQQGYFYSVDTATGAQNWRYPSGSPLSEPILSSPVVDPDGNVYFACYNGVVYSLDASGSLRWATSVPCAFLGASPAISPSGVLYIGSTEGILYALSCDDGSTDWTYSVGYPILSTASVDQEGNVYFGADDGNLYCLNPAGSLRWSFETGGAIEGSGAFGGAGRYYFGSTDGLFYALDCTATEAVVAWSLDMQGPVRVQPAVDGAGRVFFGADSGWMCALNQYGVQKWFHDLGAPVTSGFVVGQNHDLYFVGASRTLYQIKVDNLIPTLTFPSVEPITGKVGDTFTYSVYYADLNDDFPSKQFVVVDGVPHIMEYRAAVGKYVYERQFGSADVGSHTFWFYFEDGYGGCVRAPETGAFNGPVIDDAPPRSQCSSPIGTNAARIPVDYVAADDGSGVASTRLYYAYSADGSSWPSIDEAVDTGLSLVGETGTFMFEPPDGDGYYAFYTRATDRAGFVEDAPVYYYDTETLYDTTPPVSAVIANPWAFNSTPFGIQFTVSDNFSRTFTVRLYYRYNNGEWADTGLDTFQFDAGTGTGTFTFDATYGQGRYDFFTVATDEMGNSESYDDAMMRYQSVAYDVVTPESKCSSAHWTRSVPIVVTYTASDDASGVSLITPYYRYKGERSWTPLTPIPYLTPQASVSGSFEFTPDADANQLEGTYQFYTSAQDSAQNTEPAPQPGTDPDCSIVYDVTKPVSSCSASGFYTGGDVPVLFSASDNLAGLQEVRLFYNYNGGAFVRSAYVSSAQSGTFQFTPTNGDGIYCFYTIAIDKCGNIEERPVTYDALITYDTQPPLSWCSCPGTSDMVPIPITFHASDLVSEIAEVELWFKFEDGEWEDTGMAMEGSTGVFEFVPLLGQGYYYFQTIATDAAGHTEAFKQEADCSTELIFMRPSSKGSCDPYCNSSPILITFTASPNAVMVRLTYRYETMDYFVDTGSEATVEEPYFEFVPKDGEGRYWFRLFARDMAGQEEGFKSPDCSTVYDVTAPTSSCSGPPATWHHFVNVEFEASDNAAGVDRVDLWYRYTSPEDPSQNTDWEPSGLSQSAASGTFKFVFNHGLGVYDFYTVATDRAGNPEAGPGDPKLTVRYEIGAPTSRCWVITRPFSTHVTNDKDSPIQILFEASDASGNESGVKEVRLYYAYQMVPPAPIDDWTSDEIAWEYTGLKVSPDVGYFDFYPADGNGTYAFYTQAVDFAGNVQERPLLKFDVPVGVPYWDAYITYDVIAPISQCSAQQAAVELGPIYIDYDADDDPFLSDNWPDSDYDTTGVEIVTLWYRFNGGAWTESEDCWSFYDQGTFAFYPTDGPGTYDFYTICEDGAGNVEQPPATPDCSVIYGPFEPEIDVSETSYDFGTLSVGASRDWTLYIYNNGTGNLVVNDVWCDNPETFSVVPGFILPGVIAPGDFGAVTVTFHPWAIGPTSATVTIESNDDDERLVEVGVSGTAVGPLGPTVILTTNRGIYRPQDEFVASLGLVGVSEDIAADLYVAVRLPSGEVLFYPNWSAEAVGLPVWLAAGTQLPPTPFIRLRYIDGNLPRGEYRLYAALVVPGTQFELIGEVAQTRWVFN